MNKIATVKFNRQDRPEFVRELRSRVNKYFKEKGISKHANGRMVFKTIFMVSLYFIPWLLMITGVVESLTSVLLMWTLMGLGMSGIGLSIMHDANHGAYSQNKYVNKALGLLVNALGGYHVNWRIQHNVLHHSYTNIDHFDEDIENSVMRMSPHQDVKKIYKYQFLYAPVLYGIMTLYWLIGKDFQGLKRYKEKNLLEGQGLTYGKAMAEMVSYKLLYVVLFIVLPFLLVDLPWWQMALGFILMHFICGLFLALIFQPAHVIEETDFFAVDEEGSVENNWAIHQLKTTANFANGSTFFSWFVGGLNFQIEHHLFPNICHVHYKSISKIVKETAQEFGLPYHQHRTFVGAVASHFRLLYLLGSGKHDQQIMGQA